jgi:hypothetical protein
MKDIKPWLLRHLVALFMLMVAVFAVPEEANAQELPRAVPDPTREVQPATFPLRVDATEIDGTLRLYLQCGAVSAPVGMAQGRFVTTIQFPVVSLCSGGNFIVSASDFYVLLPLDGWMRYDRAGQLGGVLVCVGRQQTGFSIYTDPAHLAQACVELEDDETPDPRP